MTQRYFLFHYTWSDPAGSSGHGSLWGAFDKFPANDFLKQKAREEVKEHSQVAIVGWCEFASLVDFKNYCHKTVVEESEK